MNGDGQEAKKVYDSNRQNGRCWQISTNMTQTSAGDIFFFNEFENVPRLPYPFGYLFC